MKRILILIGVTLLIWCVLGIPASFLDEASVIALTATAATICLVPAILTLILMDLCRHRPSEQQTIVFLVSVFFRMGLTVVGGLAAYYLIPLVHQNRIAFVLWGLVFYLVTLAAEAALVYSQFRYSPPTLGSQNGP